MNQSNLRLKVNLVIRNHNLVNKLKIQGNLLCRNRRFLLNDYLNQI